jgi:hypothetical protein
VNYPAVITRIGRLLGFGMLSVAGLLGFMVFLQYRFDDPLLFLKAQSAWGGGLSIGARLIHLINPAWYALGLVEPVVDATTHAHALRSIIGGLQAALQTITFLGCAALLWVQRRPPHEVSKPVYDVVWWIAAINVAGFDWLAVSTAQNTTSALRILFGCPAILLMVFLYLRDRPKMFTTALVGFSIILGLDVAILTAGYMVI